MISSAFVKIWGKRVGAVSWNAQTELASFEFDPLFFKSNLDIVPIKMPIAEANGRIFLFPELKGLSTFKGLPGFLADILPDKYGNALINTWLVRQGRASNSLNPVEMLCFIGNRGMGALEIEPADPNSSDNSTSIDIASIVEIAEMILAGRETFSTNLQNNEEKSLVDILKIGTSAGGARAKAVIAYNTETGEVRSGQANVPNGFTHWLIKFDGVLDKQFGVSSGYGRVEMAYYLMALDAGIEMTECRLLEENGRAHFMTRRFDRDLNNNKIHVQSFCAMEHYDFNDVEFYSYEQLFETMRKLSLTYLEAEELFKRMVFNVLSKNCDDHTKNFAFIMNQKGEWKLSPAYDICFAYRPESEWVNQHALSVNGKRKNITIQDFLELANQMNIKKPKKIILEIQNIIEKWDFYANKVGVDNDLKKAITSTLQPLLHHLHS